MFLYYEYVKKPFSFLLLHTYTKKPDKYQTKWQEYSPSSYFVFVKHEKIENKKAKKMEFPSLSLTQIGASSFKL